VGAKGHEEEGRMVKDELKKVSNDLDGLGFSREDMETLPEDRVMWRSCVA